MMRRYNIIQCYTRLLWLKVPIRFRFLVLKHKSGWWRGSWWAFAIFPIEFFDIACPVIYLLCEKPPESTQVPARGFNAVHYTSKRNFHPFFIHLVAENFWIASNRSMSVEKRMIALGNSVANFGRILWPNTGTYLSFGNRTRTAYFWLRTSNLIVK